MSQNTLQLDSALQEYLATTALREPTPCRELREHPHTKQQPHLVTAAEQVQLLALLARLIGARRVLEVGTFTGYTALWLGLTLPSPDARVITLDQDETATAVAQQAWADAGVAERIELRLGAAAESMNELFHEGMASTFDLIYIDADKEGLIDYFEDSLKLVRPGGLIAVDNVLWGGQVADPQCTDRATEAVRAFNRYVHGNDRVDLSLVPIGDGLSLARRLDENDRQAGGTTYSDGGQ